MQTGYFHLGQKVCEFFNYKRDKAKNTHLYHVNEISNVREDALIPNDANYFPVLVKGLTSNQLLLLMVIYTHSDTE